MLFLLPRFMLFSFYSSLSHPASLRRSIRLKVAAARSEAKVKEGEVIQTLNLVLTFLRRRFAASDFPPLEMFCSAAVPIFSHRSSDDVIQRRLRSFGILSSDPKRRPWHSNLEISRKAASSTRFLPH
ncbi:hypothetical protein ABFS82_03G024800 [Erythranthe guttata]